MKIDPVKWNRNASLAYAVGVWTMLGYAYYKYTLGSDKVEKVVEDNSPNVKIYETKHTRTTVIYKDSEDSVPYTTMLLNFFKGTSGSSQESEKQEEEK
ncbi:hypothetical protein cypCar_00008420 [Cyprinus carpio]|nr:hypothetical protein cypCar_00008420 [Cyprinus carpio]